MTVIVDRGTEFLAKFAEMIQNNFSATKKVITTRNLQANSSIERMDQTIRDMIRSIELHESTEKDPWDLVLTVTMSAVQTTVYTMLQASLTQLMFGWDTIFNIPFEADWQLI